MNIGYIIFFGIINFLIFELLSRKVKTSKKVKFIAIFIAVNIVLWHFINPFQSSISNEEFLILFIFSLINIVFFIMSKITLWMNSHIDKDHAIFKLWDILIFYVVYIMVYLFQIVTILK